MYLERAGRVVVLTGASSGIVHGGGVHAARGASFGGARPPAFSRCINANTMTHPESSRDRDHGGHSSDPPRQPRYVGRTVAGALSPPGDQLPYHRMRV